MKTAIQPSSEAVLTVHKKLVKALKHDLPTQLVRSCLANAYAVDAEMIANKLQKKE